MEQELPMIVLKELAGNDPPSLNTFQLALLPYVAGIINAWWALWLVTAAVVMRYAWKNRVREG